MAEFKAEFGPSHTLEIIHDEGAQFLIRSTADGGAPRTTLNTIEPPVTRAVFEYAGALACEEYAQLRDKCSLRWTKIGSLACGSDGPQGICGSCNEALTRHL